MTEPAVSGRWTERQCGCGRRLSNGTRGALCRVCWLAGWGAQKVQLVRLADVIQIAQARRDRARAKYRREAAQARFEKDRPVLESLRPLQAAEHTVGSCRSLWAGVLIQAVVDFEGFGVHSNDKGGRREASKAEARAWFTSPHGVVGGFEWICGQLELDPGVIRERLFHGRIVRRRRLLGHPQSVTA